MLLSEVGDLRFQCEFRIYYDHHTERTVNDETWLSRNTRLTSFTTVQQFWELQRRLRITMLRDHSNLYIFRQSYEANWDAPCYAEDKENGITPGIRVRVQICEASNDVQMGLGIYNSPIVNQPTVDLLWDVVVSSFVSGDLPHWEQVAGVLAQRRREVRRFFLWLLRGTTVEQAQEIGRFICERLTATLKEKAFFDKETFAPIAFLSDLHNTDKQSVPSRCISTERPLYYTDLASLPLKFTTDWLTGRSRKPGGDRGNGGDKK